MMVQMRFMTLPKLTQDGTFPPMRSLHGWNVDRNRRIKLLFDNYIGVKYLIAGLGRRSILRPVKIGALAEPIFGRYLLFADRPRVLRRILSALGLKVHAHLF